MIHRRPIIGSQFGALGGLAVGLAGLAKAKTSADLVRDDDPNPPDRLLSKPTDPDDDWVDDLFEEVAADLELPEDRLHDDGLPYEIDDIDNCGWAKTLAARFGFPAEKLFVCHRAIVTGAEEEFAGR